MAAVDGPCTVAHPKSSRGIAWLRRPANLAPTEFDLEFTDIHNEVDEEGNRKERGRENGKLRGGSWRGKSMGIHGERVERAPTML